MARVHCDLFHLFTTAMRNVSLNPTQLDYARAVALSGRLDFAGVGEGLFARSDVFTGGDFQRAVTWSADCTTTATGSEGCWKVTDPVFRPGF